MDVIGSKMVNICKKIAQTAFNHGVPLSTIVTVMWREYDYMFGWALLTPEQRDAMIEDLTRPREGHPPVPPTPAERT
jgi:hypothetical protein